MAEIKLTKNELRDQQYRMNQLQKYLPTLQLKKAMLQIEVHQARQEIEIAEADYSKERSYAEGYAALLSDKVAFDARRFTKVKELKRRYENIAGVEVPYFDGISFEDVTYDLFDTPPYVDGVITGLRGLVAAGARVSTAREKKRALEKELREVSIRVNLFEKILIPRARENIKKIRIFLGDLQLAAVSQAKVAKTKIEERKQKKAHAL